MYQPVNRETSDQPPIESNKSHLVTSLGVESNEPGKWRHEPRGVREDGSRPNRLSWLIKLNLVASLLCLAGAVGFISWLWWAPHHDARWREWVLTPNRLQLSVTLAGVVIRTAVGVLAGLATAMIASVAVERRGVRLHAVAQTSVARFSSDGPLSLVSLALRGSSFDGVVRLVIMLLAVTTIAAQFSSSLLVSDFEERRVVSFTRPELNAYTLMRRDHSREGLAEAVAGYAYNYWYQRPRFAETFAEFNEPPAEGEGLDDTGPSVRAFLPVASQEVRESLLEFQGMARVMDSRVICMRPELTNLSVCKTEGYNISASLCGSVRLDRTVAAAKAGLDWSDDMNFNFSCPITGLGNDYTWQICGERYLEWTNFEWSLYNNSRTTAVRLLWDAGKIQWSSVTRNATATELNTTTSGPWTRKSLHISNPDSNDGYYAKEADISFQMTMCASFLVSKDSIQYLNVSASSSSNRTEQTYKWNVADEVYNTSDVRLQLGAVKDASHLSHGDRQILTISRDSLEASTAEAREGVHWQKYDGSPAWVWFYGRLRDFKRTSPKSIVFCPDCTSQEWTDAGTAEVIYTRLFEDTIADTGSPARALQVVDFTRTRAVYYDFMSIYSPNLDAPGADTAGFVMYQPTLIPWRFRGYAILMSTLLVFLVAFTAAAVLFRPTQFSFPENAWHTVAQISKSPELSSLLRESAMATDDEVERLDSQSGTPRFVVRDGVFVRASGLDSGMEMEAGQSRSRLTRPGPGYE
ncbi:uncharacterized protein CTRU02_210404 [Colletotrichum truncatum]|uniref:Uncharacterized protein n=1 Tax=Colletotrichum truncatum TaxID=5467 RepID=A0ACC3YNZ0_COLTU